MDKFKHNLQRNGHMELLIIPLSAIFLVIGLVLSDENFIFVSVLALFIATFLYAYKHKTDSMVYIGFLFTFFIYLMGTYTIGLFKKEVEVINFDFPIIRCMFICLYLSLLFTFIGFVTIKKQTPIGVLEFYEQYTTQTQSVQYAAKIIFYITIFANIICNLETALYVQTHSYLSLYTSFDSQIPSFIHRVAQTNEICFCVLLATLPRKKDLNISVFLYLFSNFITLFSGVRGTFVNSVLLIILYYVYRQSICRKMNNDEKWLTKTKIVMLLLLLPFMIVFLSLYNTLRNGNIPSYGGFINEIIKFFETQGGSINVIGYAAKYKNSLPDTNTSYFFGPVISLLKYGFFGSLLSGEEIIKNNTVEMALYGNNLGATLTYYVMPTNYLSGIGLGTQYIAEAYTDFGYFGVIVFGFFLGILIKKANFVQSSKWYINAIFISIILSILRMPRNFALSFVSLIVSPYNWATIILVYLLSLAIKNKKGAYKN